MSVWLWHPQGSHNPAEEHDHPKKETDLSKTMEWKEKGATAGWGWRATRENSPAIYLCVPVEGSRDCRVTCFPPKARNTGLARPGDPRFGE